MPPEPLAAVVERAAAAHRAELRARPDFPWPDAWLTSAVKAHVYPQPTGPDAGGWLTIGEVQNRSWCRVGYVMVHPATGRESVTWDSRYVWPR